MRRLFVAIAALTTCSAFCIPSYADIVAYWNQNSNGLPNGTTFGFQVGDFPQPADVGTGTLDLASFNTSTEGTAPNVKYTFIESFSGSTLNAQNADPAGGSLSPEGASAQTPTNNGMSIMLNVSTVGFFDISVSWAQRGTSTGFTSRAFSYSVDGGANYAPVGYTGDSGVLGSTFTLASIDLSSVSAVDNLTSVLFRIVLNGATSDTGNNRFDNILVSGTAVPEPAALLFGSLVCGVIGLGVGGRRLAAKLAARD